MTFAFPKPGKKKKKVTREIDESYVKWIHSYACIVCGSWPVHAHHAVSRGAGGSDRSVVPLCFTHHTGDQGIHLLGKIHFQAQFRVDLEALVSHFNELYEQGSKGPHGHKIPKINVVKG